MGKIENKSNEEFETGITVPRLCAQVHGESLHLHNCLRLPLFKLVERLIVLRLLKRNFDEYISIRHVRQNVGEDFLKYN